MFEPLKFDCIFSDIRGYFKIQWIHVMTSLFVTKDFAVKIEFAVIQELDMNPSKA